MKKLNKLSLSLVVGSLLFTQSYALPSGGKFTHGTSGSISSSNGIMNITGNKQNSVIQWGGGFNIASGETVNFKGNGKNYLNIAYGSKSSHIDGKLEGGSNNIFLINPNGIVVGKGGSINANKVFLSTLALDNAKMKEFAETKEGEAASILYSPVIKPTKGNIINLGTIKSNHIGIIAHQYSDFDKEGNIGLLDTPIGTTYVTSGSIYISDKSSFINDKDSSTGSVIANTIQGHIQSGTIIYETNDKITSTDIDSNVMNSIFNDLKFNSSVDISDLSKFYKDGQELTVDELTSINQSIDFITALYGQTQDGTNASLKTALNSYYTELEKGNNAIDTVKNTLAQISKTTEQQKNTQEAYDAAVEAYNKAVEAYNIALSGITGNNGDKVLEGLKQAVDKASSDLQQATTTLQTATASNNSSLKSSNDTLASASIDGTNHLAINGKYSANYKPVSIINSGSNNSNNGNDGTDSGDINNGNNNGSNNNPNDTIGQQEPDIATALLMQTTDEDPNINEDDKQASIDEASTQESGNACIVSDNFKAGNPCSR
ncbi:filamentous hemagglutinin N-terminal domain-containing protein [Campylobacter jejuni]|nr:filamentous hemagglutinin N-terminal domain-containing protein [Campylobacter jejuni]EAJ7038259.1 filamentous hemagglutinin N-terminal domain-containing protein [Campylobacter jejuni]EAJ7665138.1 filamentous hemagglutinin N-terminal domain-containing protein [Campylobacter jejuni]MPB48216.1 filamentous hemagglutinin N-terminal domain-containing protein [Campylobacter jejuni]